MSNDVLLRFRIAGIDEVKKALDTIGASSKRVAVAGVRAQAQAAQQGAQQVRKAGQQMLSDAEAAAAAQVAAIKKVNKARVEGAKNALQLEQQLASELAKANQQEAQAAAKRKADRAQEQADKKSALQKEQADKKAARDKEKADRKADRDQKKTEDKAASQAAREHAAGAANRRNNQRDLLTSGVRGAGRGAAMLLGGAATAATAFGVSTAKDAVTQQMALDERAALLENSSGKTKADFDSVAQAKQVSNLTGVDAGTVMSGFEKLAGKAGGGGLTEFKDQFADLAKIARGAGISMEDLGDNLGTLYNRGIKSKDVVRVVESLVQQGKDGAVEYSQLATLLDASSGALSKFKMGDSDRVMTAGGLSQFARTFGKKSAEEATNAVEDLARDLGGKADVIQKLTGGSATTVHTKGKKTKKLVNGRMVETNEGDSTKTTYAGGVEVGTDATRAQLKDINQLLPDIIEGVVKTGNAGKLTGEGGIFTGNATAIAAPLLQAFTSGISKDKEGRYQLTQDGQKSDIAGRAAVEAMLKQFAASDVKAGTSKKAFDNVMASPKAKLDQALETIKNDLGTQLSPAIQKVTPQIIELGGAVAGTIPKLVDWGTWAADNPRKAGAAFIGMFAAIETAKTGLGILGQGLLDKIFPKVVPTMNVAATSVNVVGAGAGVPPGTVPTSTPITSAPTLATALGAATVVAAGGYLQHQINSAVIDEGTDLGSNTSDASNLASKLRHGGGTAEDRERAAAMAKRYEMQSGGFGDRYMAALMGTGDRVREEGVSVSSIARMVTSVPTALVAAAQGGDSAAVNNAKGASAELREALKLDPSSKVQLGNAEALGTAIATPIVAAINAQGLQGPKAPAP